VVNISTFRYYILRRLILSFVVLFGITIITFTLTRIIPTDPAALWVGPHARKEQVELARETLGLNKPLYIQYFIYMNDLLHGNLGISIRTHRPVIEDMLTFLPASLELIISGMMLGIIFGIPLGVFSALKKDSRIDHFNRIASIGFASMPSFWLGMILQLIFFKHLGILPAGGRLSPNVAIFSPINRITGFYTIDCLLSGNWTALFDVLSHMLLPALTLAAYPMALATRMIRATMIETLEEDYIRTARAFGIPDRIINYFYALKNAIPPFITILALSFAYSLTETFLIEYVFDWPGLGRYASLAIISVDYPAIMGITLFIAFIYLFLNLIVDMIIAYLDPRIRLR